MKKSFITKLAISTIFTFALFTNISCSNLISNTDQETTQENTGKVLLHPTIAFSPRSVFPDVTIDKLENISLKYISGSSNATIAVYDNYEALESAVISLEPETYAFELQAKCGNILLKGIIEEEEYTASETVKPLNFNLKYELTDPAFSGDNKGDLSFTFTYKLDKDIDTATIKLYKYENGKLPQYAYNTQYFTTDKIKDENTRYLEYNLQNINAGIYEIQLEIKDKDNYYAYYKNSVYIAGNCTTSENYIIRDSSWVNKYMIGSINYSDISDHMIAKSVPGGISITLKFLDDDKTANQIKVIEEDSRVTITLNDWESVMPDPEHKEVTVFYPFTKKDQFYIFNLTRNRYDGEDKFYDDSERVIIRSNYDGTNIFDDDYYNKIKRMGLTVSSEAYEVKLNYDWRKLFSKVDSTVFTKFIVNGQIVAGDKSWDGVHTRNSKYDENGNQVTDSNGNYIYHKQFGDYNNKWDDGTINLLTDEGKTKYNTLLSGFTVIDPVTIENCKALGTYYANCNLTFAIKGYPTVYTIESPDSDIVESPAEERVNVTFKNSQNDPDTYVKSYKKGTSAELTAAVKTDRRFIGWGTTSGNTGDAFMSFVPTEDITLYAKYNLQINNWKYINYGEQSAEFFANIYIDEVLPDYATSLNPANPLILILQGTVVNDFEGNLKSHIYDYSNKYTTEYDIADPWETKTTTISKDNLSYVTGDSFYQEFLYTPVSGTHPYFEDGAPRIYFSTDSKNTFELTDWSCEIIQDPKKVTLVYNYPTSGAKEQNIYCKSGDAVTLPMNFSENSLIVGGWYDNAELTGSPVNPNLTSVTEDTSYYAKMDIKLQHESWTDYTTGEPAGHYVAKFDLNYLANQLGVVDQETLPANTILTKGDKIKFTFTGTPKYSFGKDFFVQIFDTENSWVNSINCIGVEETKEGSVPVTFEIITEITQTEFHTTNPLFSFGYNYDVEKGNDKENYFSDWNIKVERVIEPAE